MKRIYKNKASYGMVKPFSLDNEENNLIQQIILDEFNSQLASLGLEVLEMHEIYYDSPHIDRHYHEHVGRPYYGKLRDCLLTNKAIGMVIANKEHSANVIDSLRSVAGSTIKTDKETGEVTRLPEPGSIRYNLAFKIYQVRCSNS